MGSKRNIGIAPDEHYHIYNRGVMKRQILVDNRDYARLLFLVLFLQSPRHNFDNIHRQVNYFVQHRMFNISEKTIKDIVKNRGVSLIAFTLRPNHLHLIVKEVSKGGTAKYLQRLGNAFTKYFNAKYQLNGHLFQGPYQSVLIEDNDQLLYTSAYIHKHEPNISYEWSSYQDYVKENRWPGLLEPSLILEQFADGKEYRDWVKTSNAKETDKDGAVQHRMLNS